jgi:hypothetical protein
MENGRGHEEEKGRVNCENKEKLKKTGDKGE